MVTRRSFLASLGLAPAVARSYFDMGAAWQRHASGLLVPSAFQVGDVVTIMGYTQATGELQAFIVTGRVPAELHAGAVSGYASFDLRPRQTPPSRLVLSNPVSW